MSKRLVAWLVLAIKLQIRTSQLFKFELQPFPIWCLWETVLWYHHGVVGIGQLVMDLAS